MNVLSVIYYPVFVLGSESDYKSDINGYLAFQAFSENVGCSIGFDMICVWIYYFSFWKIKVERM